MKHNLAKPVMGAAIAALLAGCSAGASSTPPIVQTAPVTSTSYNGLQLAVGTANIAGQTGLNVVTTFRQPNGISPYGFTTPVLTWDGAFTNTAAAAEAKAVKANYPGSFLPGFTGYADANTNSIIGTAPVALSQIPQGQTFSTFGNGPQSIGIFSTGLLPDNSGVGSAFNTSIQTPCFPYYAFVATDPSFLGNTPQSFINTGFGPASGGCGNTTQNIKYQGTAEGNNGVQYVGGPPAFPQIANGTNFAGQNGQFIPMAPFAGLTPVPPTGGTTTTFTLNVTVPNAGVSRTTTAKMSDFAPLNGGAALPTPTITFDGTGGGLIGYTFPADPRVTEMMIFIINWGPGGENLLSNLGNPTRNCNFNGTAATSFNNATAGRPAFYTVRVTRSSPNPVGLGYNGTGNDPGDNLAPVPAIGTVTKGTSTHTFCTTADNANVASALGFTNPAEGDAYQIYALADDYNAYAAAPPQSNGVQFPSITGANGQADILLTPVSAITASGT